MSNTYLAQGRSKGKPSNTWGSIDIIESIIHFIESIIHFCFIVVHRVGINFMELSADLWPNKTLLSFEENKSGGTSGEVKGESI